MKPADTASRAISLAQHASEARLNERALRYGVRAPARDARQDPTLHLTPRQLEVLALLCEGLPNKLICRRLNISTGTVKVHISGILRELGVTSRLQAVVAARRYGLLGESVVNASAPAADPAPAGQTPVAAGSPEYGTLRRIEIAA
jgi:DNA-binding NarL/FixJ family response regulator